MMLSDVCRVHPVAGGVCDRRAGWRVLADRARLGRPGSRLPLRASVAGLGGVYRGGCPPTACLNKFAIKFVRALNACKGGGGLLFH